MEFVWPLISVVTLLVGFFVARSLLSKQVDAAQMEVTRLREEVSTHQAEAVTARESLARVNAEKDAAEDQLQQLREDRESLKESMQAFSAEQMEKNRNQFLKHAEETLGTKEDKHIAELSKRHESIEKQFESFQNLLDKFKEQHQEIENTRTKSFSTLEEQMKHLSEQTVMVGDEAKSLSSALKGSSQSRGRWGEMALENICELAGMTEHCDFDRQVQEGQNKRPDLVVNLPGDGKIPIDAKVPYADYERALKAESPEEQSRHLEKHGATVRETMLDLAKRDYPTVVGGEIDFTVMFIPIESVAAAAFAAQPGLQEEAIGKKILIATPVTLIALLRTVAIYWRQQKLSENAQMIAKESSELHDRLKTFATHLSKVGKNLNTAMGSFNNAVGSFQGRVIPKARSIESLSDVKSNVVPDLEVFDTRARDLEIGQPVLDHGPVDDED